MFRQTFEAIKVVHATLLGRPAGPSKPASAVEHLRRHIVLNAPLDFTLSYLESTQKHSMRVVCIHGTPGSATGWSDYVLSPPLGAQVIAVDRAGFGRSSPIGVVESLAQQAAVIAGLFPKGGPPVVIVGHSLGGAVAARIAIDYPDRVAALVLIAASLDPVLERIHPAQRIGALPWIRLALPRAIRNANSELLSLKCELEALAQKLSDVEAPTFILHGSVDPLVPVENVAFMQRRLRRAASLHVNVLAGKNHFLPWNAADDVRETIGLALAAARERR